MIRPEFKPGKELDTLVAETFDLRLAEYSTDIREACRLADTIIRETGGFFKLWSGWIFETAELSVAPWTPDPETGAPRMGKPVIYESGQCDLTHDIPGSGMAWAICQVALKYKGIEVDMSPEEEDAAYNHWLRALSRPDTPSDILQATLK